MTVPPRIRIDMAVSGRMVHTDNGETVTLLSRAVKSKN